MYLTGKSALLNNNEKTSIVYYIEEKSSWEKNMLRFDFEQRNFDKVVDHFNAVTVVAWRTLGYQEDHDAIQFSADKDVMLTGIGLLMGHGGLDYDITITVQWAAVVLEKTSKTVHREENAQDVNIRFDEVLHIDAGVYIVVNIYHLDASNADSMRWCSLQSLRYRRASIS